MQPTSPISALSPHAALEALQSAQTELQQICSKALAKQPLETYDAAVRRMGELHAVIIKAGQSVSTQETKVLSSAIMNYGMAATQLKETAPSARHQAMTAVSGLVSTASSWVSWAIGVKPPFVDCLSETAQQELNGLLDQLAARKVAEKRTAREAKQTTGDGAAADERLALLQARLDALRV